MVRFVVRVANEPARRFQLLWNLVGFGIAVVFMIIGSGYLVAGRGATASMSFHLLENLLDFAGGLRAHGFILMSLALSLSYGLGNYRRFTRWALIAVLFYSLIVAIMVMGGWFFYAISFGTPFWYLFTAFLSGVLIVLAPPLDEHGRMYRGEDDADS